MERAGWVVVPIILSEIFKVINNSSNSDGSDEDNDGVLTRISSYMDSLTTAAVQEFEEIYGGGTGAAHEQISTDGL